MSETSKDHTRWQWSAALPFEAAMQTALPGYGHAVIDHQQSI